MINTTQIDISDQSKDIQVIGFGLMTGLKALITDAPDNLKNSLILLAAAAELICDKAVHVSELNGDNHAL